ncbi:MAG: methyltransferase domain-containing protein [Alkalispirochaeta sp.]
MAATHRFSGTLAEEYKLITLAYPDFEEFQRRMVETIISQASRAPRILEIGTGNGFTTRMLLDVKNASIITVDNDPQMVEQARAELDAQSGRIEVIETDALEYLRDQPANSFDVVASAFTLHNMETTYRDPVEYEIFRVLKPGGLFTNADKYAPDGQERFDALVYQVERFFDAFVERGKLDLLRKWVTHNITDQSPRFVMPAADASHRLSCIGFENVQVGNRAHMQAVLTAWKPA